MVYKFYVTFYGNAVKIFFCFTDLTNDIRSQSSSDIQNVLLLIVKTSDACVPGQIYSLQLKSFIIILYEKCI